MCCFKCVPQRVVLHEAMPQQHWWNEGAAAEEHTLKRCCSDRVVTIKVCVSCFFFQASNHPSLLSLGLFTHFLHALGLQCIGVSFRV